MHSLIQWITRHPIYVLLVAIVAAIGVASTWFNEVTSAFKAAKEFLTPTATLEQPIAPSPTPAIGLVATAAQDQPIAPSPTLNPATTTNQDWGVVQKLSEQKKQSSSMLTPSPSPLNTGKMSPEAITEDIEESNPMMREGIAKEYVGALVDWTLEFRSARTSKNASGKECIAVTLISSNSALQIAIDLPVERKGELQVIPFGEKIHIKGTITEVTSGWISVDASEFKPLAAR
jgi:hypothetical protein